jgi:spore maturation protein SpmA
MARAMTITVITEGNMADPDRKAEVSGKAKRVALVIAGTMLLWLGGQRIGAEMGVPLKYSFLIDLAAMAGFIWAMVVTYQIWRDSRT